MAEEPESVTVKKKNNEKIKLLEAFIQNHSLKGYLYMPLTWYSTQPFRKDSISIALNDILDPIKEVMLEKPKLVKVEKTDSSLIELYDAFIQNDSITGYVLGKKIGNKFYPNVKDSKSIALNEITQIERHQFHLSATLAVILVPLAVVGVYYMAKYIYLSVHGVDIE